MAVITSNAVTGNASATSSWVGGVAPVDGDTIVIANGAVITQDVNRIYGAKTATPGHAVTINGASSVSAGTFQVAAGVTLTLRGVDTVSNTLMLVNRFGLFAPLAGSTILGDVSTDFASVILNKGMINALGTAGSPIMFSIPTANYNWSGGTVTAQSVSVGSYQYDTENHVAFGMLFGVTGGNSWISNAAGTGIGAWNDNSVTFGGSGATQFTNAVSSIGAIATTGDYFIECDKGVLYFYFAFPGTAPTAYTVTYKFLSSVLGWGINSIQGTTYNEARFDHCVFNYFGAHSATGGTSNGITVAGHDGGQGTRQRFQFTNSTVQWCSNFLYLYSPSNNGNAANPILITGNTVNHCRNSATKFPFITAPYGGSYVYINSNNFNINNTCVYALPTSFVTTYQNWQFNSNTGMASEMLKGLPYQTVWPGSEIAFNVMTGGGGIFDARMFWGFTGSSSADANRAKVHDNVLTLVSRVGQLNSYLDIYNNVFIKSTHHGLTASTQDTLIRDVKIYNNLWYGKMTQTPYYVSPAVELGYNVRSWIDNVLVINNTVCNQGGAGGGFLDLGDSQDSSTTLITRVVAVNNLCDQEQSGGPTKYAIRRPANASTWLTRCHIGQIDYNLDYGCSARYDTNNLFTQQGTFLKGGTNYCVQAGASRNIPGLSLHNPGFPSFAGTKSVSLVVTSSTNITLSWDGSSATQLVLDTGGSSTVSATNTNTGGAYGLYNGTLTDTSKAWSTTLTSATCYRLRWLWVYSGTAAGYVGCITNNTATSLTVVPGFVNRQITAMSGNTVSPVTCTAVAHGFSNGQIVFVQGCIGNTALNNAYWTITVTDADHFTCPATGNGTYNPAPGGFASIVPDTTSLYAILESELTLTGTGSVTSGTNTVQCGIYLPDLVATLATPGTYTDTGISFGDNSITGSNPLLVAPNGTTTASYKFTAGSSAIDVATAVNAPATDYYGTARPQGPAIDIGFFELLVGGGVAPFFLDQAHSGGFSEMGL